MIQPYDDFILEKIDSILHVANHPSVETKVGSWMKQGNDPIIEVLMIIPVEMSDEVYEIVENVQAFDLANSLLNIGNEYIVLSLQYIRVSNGLWMSPFSPPPLLLLKA